MGTRVEREMGERLPWVLRLSQASDGHAKHIPTSSSVTLHHKRERKLAYGPSDPLLPSLFDQTEHNQRERNFFPQRERMVTLLYLHLAYKHYGTQGFRHGFCVSRSFFRLNCALSMREKRGRAEKACLERVERGSSGGDG